MKDLCPVRCVDLELTNSCNLQCAHCYAAAGPQGQQMMPPSLISKILDDAKEISSVRHIVFSGGEPLLSPYLDYAIQQAIQRGFAVSVETNGTLISKSNIDLFRNLTGIQIGYDLPISEGGVRAIPKNLLEEKIRLLRENNINPLFLLQVTLHKKNAHAIDYFINKAQSLNILLSFNLIKPSGRGGNNPQFLLSKSETKQILERLYDLYLDEKIFRISETLMAIVARNNALRGKFDPNKHLWRCDAVGSNNVFYVTPEGKLLLCPLLRDIEMGDLRKSNLSELVVKSRVLDRLNLDTCGCPLENECMGCRVRALYYTGRVNALDPLCFRDDDKIYKENMR